MERLDTEHELLPAQEPLELSPPHRGEGWLWIFGLTFGITAMFVTLVILYISGSDIVTMSIVAPVVLVFVTFLGHAVAERAR